MTEYLYQVNFRNKETGEQMHLNVWAESADAATYKLTGTLIGFGCEYAWVSTGPLYKNNQLISRKFQKWAYQRRIRK